MCQVFGMLNPFRMICWTFIGASDILWRKKVQECGLTKCFYQTHRNLSLRTDHKAPKAKRKQTVWAVHLCADRSAKRITAEKIGRNFVSCVVIAAVSPGVGSHQLPSLTHVIPFRHSAMRWTKALLSTAIPYIPFSTLSVEKRVRNRSIHNLIELVDPQFGRRLLWHLRKSPVLDFIAVKVIE